MAVIQRDGKRPGLWVTPLDRPDVPADRLRAALTWLVASGLLEEPDIVAVSAPQSHAALLESLLGLGEGGDWEWMWTTTPPATDPREADIVELDDRADGSEIEAFSRRNNPRVWTEIGTGRMHGWLGLRTRPALIAVGGPSRRRPSSRGHRHRRGQIVARSRLGHLAALTRRAIAGTASALMFTTTAPPASITGSDTGPPARRPAPASR